MMRHKPIKNQHTNGPTKIQEKREMSGGLWGPDYTMAKPGFTVAIGRAVTDIRTEDYLILIISGVAKSLCLQSNFAFRIHSMNI